MAKKSFPPIIGDNAKVLILGSLPGDVSLGAQEYYANKNNAFWGIMEQLFNIDRQWSYSRRLQSLQLKGIALWDVIESGEREGSLDSAIKHDSLSANRFDNLFQQYPALNTICLNGGTVNTLFKRHVLRKQTLPESIHICVLPSTSPANARLNFQQKLEKWQEVLCYL